MIDFDYFLSLLQGETLRGLYLDYVLEQNVPPETAYKMAIATYLEHPHG